MKSNRLHRIVRLTGATVALAFVLGSVASALADNTIAASPRLTQSLKEQAKASTAAPVAAAPMACAKCKDKVTSKIDTSARGVNKPVIQVATHLCPMCGVNWTTTGTGKAKETVALHTCGSCTAAN